MQQVNDPNSENLRNEAWAAVFGLMLCVATLIASEVMPISLLTPIAQSLRTSEGQVGEAISISGVCAAFVSIFIVPATSNINRRHLFLGLNILLAASGILVSAAPNLSVLTIGRALLGLVIGGFWSLSTEAVVRLVSARNVPRALALLNGGNAVAVTVGAPLGSFLGQYIGWRETFFCVVPLAIFTTGWLYRHLPYLPAPRHQTFIKTLQSLAEPQIPQGLGAVGLLFLGQLALFTYVRPFLEEGPHMAISSISMILFGVGAAGFIGTWLIGVALRRYFYSLLTVIPVAMAIIALGLIVSSRLPTAAAGLLLLWGLFATAAPVGWWTWITKVAPRNTEAVGGAMVAVVQLAIALGTFVGGTLFDQGGFPATFTFSAIALLGSAVSALSGWRSSLKGRNCKVKN